MFGDSSLDFFCSVLLRTQKNAYSKCQLAFVFGKARVVPMKMLSTSKADIKKALTMSFSMVFMWTDSTTVLQWLELDKPN